MLKTVFVLQNNKVKEEENKEEKIKWRKKIK